MARIDTVRTQRSAFPLLQLSFAFIFRHHRSNFATNQPHCISQHLNHRHSINHATQSKLTLPHRRQRPPANEQPTLERIQTPPVCGNNVQQDSTFRRHCEVKSYELRVVSYQSPILNYQSAFLHYLSSTQSPNANLYSAEP